MSSFLQQFATQIQTIAFMVMIINAILHVIFAGAVARDAGNLAKRNVPTFLVSGFTWAFATLVGGVIVATIYWLIHYSGFRQGSKS